MSCVTPGKEGRGPTQEGAGFEGETEERERNCRDENWVPRERKEIENCYTESWVKAKNALSELRNGQKLKSCLVEWQSFVFPVRRPKVRWGRS